MTQQALAEQTETQGLSVEERITLTVAHNGEDLTFLHPVYGPGTYTIVKEAIEKDNLKTPTIAETVSLVHTAFNSNDEYSNEIKQFMKGKWEWAYSNEMKRFMKVMKGKWMWGFTGTLYTPKGVYIQDNPEVRDRMPFMEESELVNKLEANDSSVRFVPFGFDVGEMTSSQLSKNDYIIALVGEEGSYKLAEIADKHKKNPILWSFKSVDTQFIRVSALGSYSGAVLGFDAFFDFIGNYGSGFGSGVLRKTDEPSYSEKQ